MRRARKRGPGSPSLGDAARSRVVTIKLTEAEHAAWLALAGDQPLSDWIRARCSTAPDPDKPDNPGAN